MAYKKRRSWISFSTIKTANRVMSVCGTIPAAYVMAPGWYCLICFVLGLCCVGSLTDFFLSLVLIINKGCYDKINKHLMKSLLVFLVCLIVLIFMSVTYDAR